MSRQGRQGQCPQCGGVFLTVVRTKVYCRERCRKRAESARWRARLKEAW